MAAFDTEREGQMEFYRTFLPNVNPNISLEDILADNNDGVLNGLGQLIVLRFRPRIRRLVGKRQRPEPTLPARAYPHLGARSENRAS